LTSLSAIVPFSVSKKPSEAMNFEPIEKGTISKSFLIFSISLIASPN
jgi:hypothetical protein